MIRKPLGLKAMDSVAAAHSMPDYKKKNGAWPKNLALLHRAEQAWLNMDDLRRQGARANRFVYGDQWADPITIMIDGCRQTMTMREYLALDGHVPMQANQLRTTVDTIVGVLVKEQNEPICNARDRDEQQYGELMTAALQANCNKNKLNTIYKLCTRDILIKGIAVAKERYGYNNRREDSWTEYVNPNYLILETTLRDPRFWDITMVGTWYEMPFQQLAGRVVKSHGDLKALEEVYQRQLKYEQTPTAEQLTDEQDPDQINFMRPAKHGNCAVAEIWTLETKERIRVHDTNEGTLEVIDADDKEMLAEIKAENRERIALAREAGWSAEEVPTIELEYFIDEYWYCQLMAPDGSVLWEEESPYPDRLHPFTIMATPLVDGLIQPWVNDGIDIQIAMNRALVLQDWIARNQVKGFTMIPQELVPDGMSNADFVQSAINIGNVYFYDTTKLKGAKPEVFHTGAVNYDATNYISTLKQLLEASTSVSGALQGKTPYSGTSAALYAQQTSNSSTPIASILEDIRTFMENTATKKAKNIAEFYDVERFRIIAGSMADIAGNSNMNLDLVKDIEFDLAIKESTETPVYRAISNDTLLQFLQMGLLDLETVLEAGSFPFADQILQKLQARQAEAQSMQEAGVGAPVDGGGTAGGVENPVETQGYGVPIVGNTRPLVQ